MWWFSSPKIIFGEDSLDFLDRLDGKVLIITDENLIKACVLDKVTAKLSEYEIFDEVKPDPSFEVVVRAVKHAKRYKPDLIFGVGGGSSLDVAKGVRLIYDNPNIELEEVTPWTDLEVKTKLILIPTASGSGSEASNAIVLTKEDENRKIASINPAVMADYAIVDPEMVKSLPKKVAAFTGLDALSHAIDAYVSAWKNDFVDGICIQACKLLFEYLPRAYKDREDAEAVEKVHNAATLAGLAIGSSQAGLSHAIGHSLAIFHIPHGFACGVVLPYTIQYYSKYAKEYYEELAYHVGLHDVEQLVEKIKDLMVAIDTPTNLRELLEEYGVSKEEFLEKLDVLVNNASMDNTIVTLLEIPSDEDLRKIFLYAYEGRDVDF
ncbi:NAD-dependent alcohol dehydrogenase [Archaeoglobales archaeon]|nr:MAG: NAD-dependent alcohol dehydrogenase [Archaeoglobales archaeon]